MTRADLTRARWRKSSYSNSNSNCVEISEDFPGVVPVRDSKDPQGPALAVSPDAWRTFVGFVTDRRDA